MSIFAAISENKTNIANSLVTIFASVIANIEHFNLIVRTISGVLGVIVGVFTLIKIARELRK